MTINNNETARIEKETKNLGKLKTILKLISEHNIEDIIIATEENENHKIEEILTILEQTNVFVQVIPDISDILYGRVKMNSILATPLIKINNDIQPEWEKRIKLFSDYLFALICIILFSPIYLICGIIVKLSSKGPIIYKQKRIGINGKSFTIFKFRSMFIDSEKNGPQLSSKKDARITRFGKFMRKVRLDETPQFFNILKGDMSFVGPRPEREYFAKKLLEKSPYYSKIYKVKPGITSWGMVKYGYAENIEEMSERLKYDLLYLKNRSLLIDLKIMIHTIAIIFEGRGK